MPKPNCTNGNYDNIPPPIPRALTPSLYYTQSSDFCLFDRIQAINSNVSTSRSLYPNVTPPYSYYIFSTYAERTAFTNGRLLHIRDFPNSNWDVVVQN